MKRFAVVLVTISALALGGCVAALAMSAADMALSSARGRPVSNEHLKPAAEAACSARAAPHGVVKVIDLEQRSVGKIVVWGTAGAGAERRSFECHFTTQITRFTLREIKPR